MLHQFMRERKCKICFFADKGNMNKHIKSNYEDRKEFKIFAPHLPLYVLKTYLVFFNIHTFSCSNLYLRTCEINKNKIPRDEYATRN